ncbi:MAG: zinc ribbon domain-containing protein [Candidatus Methanofastidiosia archaeon]|jgi:predicted nucleic acid-binding Zn ribbon protein
MGNAEYEFCPNCGAGVTKDSNFCSECGKNLQQKKKEKEKLDIKEYVAFIILLILGDFSLMNFHTRFAAISHLLSWLDRIMANPEFYKEELNAMKDLAVSMVDGWQFNAWMLAIVGFLLGIMLMRWINKIGKGEGFKHALGCFILIIIFKLIAKSTANWFLELLIR